MPVPLSRRSFLALAGQAMAAPPWRTAASAKSLRNQRSQAYTHAASQAVHLDVRDFGATGDGSTKDTLALQSALDRCSVLGGGEVLVPAGDYLAGALLLRSNTHLRLAAGATLLASPDLADYPLTQVRWEGRWVTGYAALLSAVEAHDVAITGEGRIVGNPAIKGRLDPASHRRNPALIEFTKCVNVVVQDCVTTQNDMWSIHPVLSDNLLFQDLTVNGGADGIDIDSCRHVVIQGCTFDTGDDCISLKSGRGEEGYTLAHPTEDVLIRNCTFADRRWACIGIGSETSGGIRNVRVEHCRCLRAGTFAIYIKSRPGRGAAIEDITMTDLEIVGTKDGFLRLNTLNSGLQDEFPVPGEAGLPALRNLRFRNIRVTGVPTLVDARAIHPAKPLEGFTLAGVTGTCGQGLFLANIHDAALRDISVTGFTGPLLHVASVTGSGLQGAVPFIAPPPPPEIPTPTQPYVLQ